MSLCNTYCNVTLLPAVYPCSRLSGIVHEFCQFFGLLAFGDGGCHNNVDAGFLGELLKLKYGRLKPFQIVAADFESRVDENIGNIVVACDKTGDKALTGLGVVYKILVDVDKPYIIVHFKAELDALIHPDDISLEFLTASFTILIRVLVLPVPGIPVISFNIFLLPK